MPSSLVAPSPSETPIGETGGPHVVGGDGGDKQGGLVSRPAESGRSQMPGGSGGGKQWGVIESQGYSMCDIDVSALAAELPSSALAAVLSSLAKPLPDKPPKVSSATNNSEM